MNRAVRRHHKQRIKKKRSKYFNCWNSNDPVLVGIISKTPKPCSCYCCGNPRRTKKWIWHKLLYDQGGNKTIVRETITVGKKDRLTKQEKIHSLNFELEAE